MIFEKIIDKIIADKLEDAKEKAANFLDEYREEIFAKIKKDVSDYITAHKEEILKLLQEKALEYAKEFIIKQKGE